MSKAILILDEMPGTCLDCELGQDGECLGDEYCGVSHTRFDFDEWDKKRRDDCKLLKCPERKQMISIIKLEEEAKENGIEPWMQNWFNKGWNACLKELEGESNE